MTPHFLGEFLNCLADAGERLVAGQDFECFKERRGVNPSG